MPHVSCSRAADTQRRPSPLTAVMNLSAPFENEALAVYNAAFNSDRHVNAGTPFAIGHADRHRHVVIVPAAIRENFEPQPRPFQRRILRAFLRRELFRRLVSAGAIVEVRYPERLRHRVGSEVELRHRR